MKLSKSFHLYLIAFVLLMSNLSYSQQINDTIPSKCLNSTYIKSYFTDFTPLILSPAKWSGAEWISAGGVIAATSMAFVFDERINTFSQKNSTKFLDDANEYFFDPFGKMYYTVPFMGALYLYGLSTDNIKPKVVALDFVKASFYSGVIITGIKHVAHRHRPFQTDPKNSMLWDGPITDDLAHTSFASGHTIMAFTFASVLATHYKNKKWIPLTVYTLAGLSGLARIYADKHWTSDVIVGAALGYAIGKWVVNNNRYCNISINPVLGNNYNGLSLGIAFGKPKS